MISQSVFSKEIKDSIIFHIPHSSTVMIPEFFDKLDAVRNEVDIMTDTSTDEIFKVEGIKQMIFPFSRVICDVERFADSSKELEGRGFNYTKTYNGKNLFKKDKITDDFVKDFFYDNWNTLMRDRIDEVLNFNDTCTIIDCHSFNESLASSKNIDICIGVDEVHTPRYLQDIVQQFFERSGYSVAINQPYSGSYVPEYFYGSKYVNSIMIEINKKLYMSSYNGVIENWGVQKAKVSKLNSLINSLFSF